MPAALGWPPRTSPPAVAPNHQLEEAAPGPALGTALHWQRLRSRGIAGARYVHSPHRPGGRVVDKWQDVDPSCRRTGNKLVRGGEISFRRAVRLDCCPGNWDPHTVDAARAQALKLVDARRRLRRDAPEIRREGHRRGRSRGQARQDNQNHGDPGTHQTYGALPRLSHGQLTSGEAVAVGRRLWRRCLSTTTATEAAARSAIAIRIGTRGDDDPPPEDGDPLTPWLPVCSGFSAATFELPPGLPCPVPPPVPPPAPAPFFADDSASPDPLASFELPGPVDFDAPPAPPLSVLEDFAGVCCLWCVELFSPSALGMLSEYCTPLESSA